MNPPSSSPSLPVQGNLLEIWSKDLLAPVCGLSLARERGWLLAWDKADWLYLLDQVGQPQAQRQLQGLNAAAAAEDCSAYAATGKEGEIWWLAPDLMARWEKKLPYPALALALDPFGQYLALADSRQHLYVFDRPGHVVCRVKTARPLSHLAFVPSVPILIGSADYGLVAGFDLTGETVWRDGLVANVGGLSVDGAGEHLLCACFSEGLHRYDAAGKKLPRMKTPEPCRLVTQSFDGRRILVSNMKNRLYLLDKNGEAIIKHSEERAIIALALGALGKDCFAALDKGPLMHFKVEQDKP